MPGDMVEQAILAVGGHGTRLGPRKGDEPKSLIEVHGKPIIYWTLRALRAADVRRVLLVCDRMDFAARIEEVASSVAKLFESIDLVVDRGYGVHGIPVQVRERLDARFLFEAGHSLLPHLHYRRMSTRHRPGRWVMSSFPRRRPNPSRFPLTVRVESATLAPRVAALPYLLERDYCDDIQSVGYRIRLAIEARQRQDRIDFVESAFPPEFDQPDELDEFQSAARSFLRRSGGDLLATGRREEGTWPPR
jgi:hypothetical protein